MNGNQSHRGKDWPGRGGGEAPEHLNGLALMFHLILCVHNGNAVTERQMTTVWRGSFLQSESLPNHGLLLVVVNSLIQGICKQQLNDWVGS